VATAEPITIPLTVDGARALEILESFAQAMGKAAEKTDDAGKKAKESTVSWTEMKSALDLASMAFERLVGFADQVAALTAEQQQLTAASARLGLDFNEAADGAGRFVDETEAMAAASRLAEAGLHLTQEELNQLTARAAIASQRLGVDTTTAFNMLTTAIESGSTRALRPFGEDMVRLGGSTHSAEERLSAFTTTTRGMERATDDASTSMARLRDSIGDAEREMASSFSAELLRLATISERTTAIGTQMDDSTDKLRGFGTMAANVAAATLNGIAVVVGSVAMGIVGTINMAQGALAGLRSLAHGGSFSDGMHSAMGSDSASAEVLRFLEGRIDALNALADDNGSTAGRGAVRGRIGSAGAAAPSGDMVFGESQADADDAFAAAHRRHRTGGAGGAGRGESAEQRARRIMQERRAQSGDTAGLASMFSGATAEVHSTQERARSSYDQQMAERHEDVERVNRAVASEQREEREAFGGREGQLAQRFRQYGDMARTTADRVVGAFNDMTGALTQHMEAWARGKETFAEAMQGMLGDFLMATSKRAMVAAVEEGAAAIASLAIGDLRGAGLHAASAAGYTALAALSGAAGGAVSWAPDKGHSGGGGARSAADVTPRAAGKDAGGSVVNNIYFGGPVIGAGGARQAAREVVGVLNDGARQGGVRLDPRILPMGAH